MPVDIITHEQIASSGYAETAQVIQSLAPSFNFPRPTITDGTDTVRPATLRGLGPDQVLVLDQRQAAPPERARALERQHRPRIDRRGPERDPAVGDRSHRSAPRRRRGAVRLGRHRRRDQHRAQERRGAAQRDVELRSVEGVVPRQQLHVERARRARRATTSTSRTADWPISEASWGLAAGKGSVTVAAEYRHHNRTNRASFDPRDQIVAGDAGNNAVAEPNHRWGDPDTRDVMTFLNASVPLNSAETRFLYAFGGYSRRDGEQRRLLSPRARRAQLAADLSARVPAGDRADRRRRVGHRRRPRRAATSGTTTPAASTGTTAFAFTIGDTLNVSLGPSLPPNKTQFDAGTLELNQFVGNVDVSRPFRSSGLAGPLNVAVRRGVPPRELSDTRGRAGLVRRRRRAGSIRRPCGDRRAGLSRLPSVERGGRVAQQRRRLRRRRRQRDRLAAARRRRTRGALQRFRRTRWTASSPHACSPTRVSSCAARSAPASARRRSASRSSRRRRRTS